MTGYSYLIPKGKLRPLPERVDVAQQRLQRPRILRDFRRGIKWR